MQSLGPGNQKTPFSSFLNQRRTLRCKDTWDHHLPQPWPPGPAPSILSVLIVWEWAHSRSSVFCKCIACHVLGFWHYFSNVACVADLEEWKHYNANTPLSTGKSPLLSGLTSPIVKTWQADLSIEWDGETIVEVWDFCPIQSFLSDLHTLG